MKTMPAHFRIADKLITLMAKGREGNSTNEYIENGRYKQTKNSGKAFYLNQEIAIIDQTIYDNIDMNAIKLLIRIQQELKPNNPIWTCEDKDKTQVRLAIAQLRDKDILDNFGDDIYIVNPEKIRRGKPLATLAALYIYCKKRWLRDKNWRLSNADIKKLNAPEDEEIDEIIEIDYKSTTINEDTLGTYIIKEEVLPLID